MSEFERTRDRELLRRFQAGDRDGFAELYRLHSRSVYRFALYVAADEAKAAEITQDVFVWFIDHGDRFDAARGSLSSFLIGVARLKLKQRFREEQRWVELEDSLPAERVDDSAEHDLDRLRSAMARLPLRYREAVVLCDLEEKTYEEAAALLECPLGTVRSRLHRARALLAQKILGKQLSKKCKV
jgi:RNA polymerase sigma-70 factor (ECF subfamily)